MVDEPSKLLAGVAGHDAWKRYFERALETGRLAPTYLFVGPAGSGKWTFAQALARRVVCQRPTPDACGTCGPCVRAAAGTHPDVTLVDAVAEGDRGVGVDIARERISEAFRLRPSESAYRVVLVNDADRMELAAQNALLKTLEEPPPGALLLLVAPSTTGLLDTVLSRCFVLRFKPVPDEALTRFLMTRGLTADEAARRSAASGGLPGLALDFAGESAELAELCARLVAGRATPEEVGKRLGDLAQERDERSAFERRRRAGLALCGVLASELRKQLMVESDNQRLQDLLLDVATASRNLLAPATPELVVDALLERFRNETLDRPR